MGKSGEGVGHIGQMALAQTPAGRVPNMDMAWQRTMSGANDVFARTSSGGLPSMMPAEGGAQQAIMSHWDAAALGAVGANMPMDVWGGMHAIPHHTGLHPFGFSHEHMSMMPPGMYHGLHMAPQMAGMAGRLHQGDGVVEQGGKGKKGRGKNKVAKAKLSDAEVRTRRVCVR